MDSESGPVGSIVVTGASRGIGRALCRSLVASGRDVVGIARRRPADWGDGVFIEADLASSEGLRRAVDGIASLPAVWGLVNDAGMGSDESLDELDRDHLSEVLHLNTVVPAVLAQAACTRMEGGGRIVNLGSVVALGAVRRTSYGASKAALAAMTRTWALELASRGITVNTIAPGPIETDLFRQLNPAGSPQETTYLSRIPVGRFGLPEDLAELITLVLSPTMSYLTGQTIFFDGGFTVGRAAT